MLVAVDIGNTSTAIGIYKESELLSYWRTGTKKEFTSDQFALLFRDFFAMKNYEFKNVAGFAVSSVVPSLNHSIASMSKRYFHLEPMCIDSTNVGIKINYPNPVEIGADRLVNAVAAYEKFKSKVIVIDFGTATTFDYVDESGAYCGGAIAPGIAISNEALYHWTSKLPRVDIAKTETIIGKSTTEAIKAGVYNGYVGLVKNILQKMKAETGTDTKVIATGGLASLIVKELDIPVDKFLTLNGIRIAYSSCAVRNA